MQEPIDNRSRQMGTLRKRNAKNKKIIAEMKNASDGFFSRLNMAEKRISELEDTLRVLKN